MRFSQRLDFETAPNRLDELKRAFLARGRSFRDASLSNPTRTGLGPDYESTSRAFSDLPIGLYRPEPRGPLDTREVLASHLSTAGARLDPGRFSICSSTSEAYSYLFKLFCDPGDSILVPRPGYPLFDHLAALESVQAVGYRCYYARNRGWFLDFDQLARAADSDQGRRARILVAIHPNNPTGSYLSRDEIRTLIDFCADRSLVLVADEVFFNYDLEPREEPLSLLGATDTPVFVLDGLSKRLCLPQVKLGWIYAAGPEKEAREALSALDIISDAFLSAGTPALRALPNLLAMEGSVISKAKGRMRKNLATFRNVLEFPGSPHEVLRCEGGWTALVRSPRLSSEEELAAGLLEEEGILIQPGYFFDMEREAYFAFSLIAEEGEALASVSSYREFFRRHGA